MRSQAPSTITRFIIAVVFLVGIGTAEAKIVVPPTGSVIEVDQATLKAVLGTFEQAEEAIKAHDLDKVMAGLTMTLPDRRRLRLLRQWRAARISRRLTLLWAASLTCEKWDAGR